MRRHWRQKGTQPICEDAEILAHRFLKAKFATRAKNVSCRDAVRAMVLLGTSDQSWTEKSASYFFTVPILIVGMLPSMKPTYSQASSKVLKFAMVDASMLTQNGIFPAIRLMALCLARNCALESWPKEGVQNFV